MNSLQVTRTPREVDEALATAWHAQDAAERQLHFTRTTLTRVTEGAKGIRAKYTSAGRYVPQVTDAEALAYVRSLNPDEYSLGGYSGSPGTFLAEWDARTAAVDAARAEIARLDDLYTGWSRFFLVTSSTGHIHRSMYCSTCRPSTTYGWLPALSGQTESEAVAAHGPALCSVCFPSAPVEHQANKITKAQAVKLAA